jgi:hypothetical protein
VLAPGTQAHGQVPRCVVTAALLCVLASGCSFATKAAEGRAVHEAPEVLGRSGSVALTLTVSSRLVEKGALTTVPPADPGFRVSGLLDLNRDRASYTAGGRRIAVFDDKRAYALRPNARPNDARPWVRVSVDEDLSDRLLDPSAIRPSLAVLALRPSVLIDALVGALTGSIENEGPDTVDGTPTTRYTARFDLPQALSESERRRYSQRQQDDLAHFFEILGIEEDALHDGTVWLDNEGRPRRLKLDLHQEPAQKSLIRLSLDLRLAPRAAGAPIDVPDASSVTTVPSLFQYLQPLAPGPKP